MAFQTVVDVVADVLKASLHVKVHKGSHGFSDQSRATAGPEQLPSAQPHLRQAVAQAARMHNCQGPTPDTCICPPIQQGNMHRDSDTAV